MMQTLEAILNYLNEKYVPHTAILYGSRAGDQFRVDSDYDFLLIRANGSRVREIIDLKGACIDLIVEDEGIINRPFDTLYLWQSNLLRDDQGFGSLLIVNNQKLLSTPPQALPMNRVRQRKKQVHDELIYLQRNDVLGNYRRHDLLVKLRILYLSFKQVWDLGDKHSFEWMSQNDQEAYELFEIALRPEASFHDIKILAEFILRIPHL